MYLRTNKLQIQFNIHSVSWRKISKAISLSSYLFVLSMEVEAAGD